MVFRFIQRLGKFLKPRAEPPVTAGAVPKVEVVPPATSNTKKLADEAKHNLRPGSESLRNIDASFKRDMSAKAPGVVERAATSTGVAKKRDAETAAERLGKPLEQRTEPTVDSGIVSEMKDATPATSHAEGQRKEAKPNPKPTSEDLKKVDESVKLDISPDKRGGEKGIEKADRPSELRQPQSKSGHLGANAATISADQSEKDPAESPRAETGAAKETATSTSPSAGVSTTPRTESADVLLKEVDDPGSPATPSAIKVTVAVPIKHLNEDIERVKMSIHDDLRKESQNDEVVSAKSKKTKNGTVAESKAETGTPQERRSQSSETPKDPNAVEKVKVPKDKKAVSVSKSAKSTKAPKEPKLPKEPKPPKEPKDQKSPKKTKAPKEPKIPEESKAPAEPAKPKKIGRPKKKLDAAGDADTARDTKTEGGPEVADHNESTNAKTRTKTEKKSKVDLER